MFECEAKNDCLHGRYIHEDCVVMLNAMEDATQRDIFFCSAACATQHKERVRHQVVAEKVKKPVAKEPETEEEATESDSSDSSDDDDEDLIVLDRSEYKAPAPVVPPDLLTSEYKEPTALEKANDRATLCALKTNWSIKSETYVAEGHAGLFDNYNRYMVEGADYNKVRPLRLLLAGELARRGPLKATHLLDLARQIHRHKLRKRKADEKRARPFRTHMFLLAVHRLVTLGEAELRSAEYMAIKSMKGILGQPEVFVVLRQRLA